MTKYIATRLHKLLERAPDDALLLRMLDQPHYVLDQRLTDLLQREDMVRSIVAVIEAGIDKLPFPSMVVEYDVTDHKVENGNTFRILVLLTETVGGFTAEVINDAGDVITVTREPIPLATYHDPEPGVLVGNGVSKSDQVCAAFALMACLLMLNIAGIDKEVIDPVKLNRSRTSGPIADRKPAIPRHILLHIGTVMSRDGTAIKLGGGRHMPVHMRAGHIRHQAHGRAMSERKVIYIPPVLVNYHPGDEIKQPKKLVTK